MRRVFRFVRIKEFIDASKELYTGTPNSDIRILCTVHCGRNVNKPAVPLHISWSERTTALMWYYSPTKKNKLTYIKLERILDFWLSGQYGKYNSNIFLFTGPFPSKMMRCPWILCFDLLPLQYTDLTHEMVVPGLYISWTLLTEAEEI